MSNKVFFLAMFMLIGLALAAPSMAWTGAGENYTKCINVVPYKVVNNAGAYYIVINNSVAAGWRNDTFIQISNSSQCDNPSTGDSSIKFFIALTNNVGMGRAGNSYIYINPKSTAFTNFSIYYNNKTSVISYSDINGTSSGFATDGMGADGNQTGEVVANNTSVAFSYVGNTAATVLSSSCWDGACYNMRKTTAGNPTQINSRNSSSIIGKVIVVDMLYNESADVTTVGTDLTFLYPQRMASIYVSGSSSTGARNAFDMIGGTTRYSQKREYARIRIIANISLSSGVSPCQYWVNQTNQTIDDCSDNFFNGVVWNTKNVIDFTPENLVITNSTIDNFFISQMPDIEQAQTWTFGAEKTFISDTCTPTDGQQWNLNLADNCTITGLTWSGPKWNISSSGQGRTILSYSNLTYSNLTYGSFIQWAALVFNTTTRIIRK